MAKVTLQSIAEQVGLSKYAVSRALAGKSGVSEQTREKIVSLAAQLGYERPTSKAQRMAIAIICEDEDLINGELNQKILAGIRHQTHECGYDLIELQTTGARRLSDVDQRMDGLILIGVNRPEIRRVVEQMDIPCVKIGNFEPLEEADLVRGTNYESGRVVGDLFLANSHRNLVYVRGRRDFRGRQERYNGFVSSTFSYPDARILDLRWQDSDELNQALDELLAGPEPATGFFCAHDGLAVTIISELLTRNIRIPHDASVVGYGDYMTAQQVRPALTTVSVPGVALGREAVRLVQRRIENLAPDDYRIRVQVPSKIMHRESLGPRRG
ncbi:MAG: LacI family DNA-binding transcriptional regulator [Pseudomonadota bacterium]